MELGLGRRTLFVVMIVRVGQNVLYMGRRIGIGFELWDAMGAWILGLGSRMRDSFCLRWVVSITYILERLWLCQCLCVCLCLCYMP